MKGTNDMKPKNIAIAAIAALALASAPSAFAEDAYIMSQTETDGKAYSIDTGYLMSPNTCIVADFEFTATTAAVFPNNKYQQFVFETSGPGTGTVDAVARIYVNGQTGTGNIAWNLSEQNNWRSTGLAMTPGKRYVMTLDGYHRHGTLLVDGSQAYSADMPAEDTVLTANTSLKLFGNVGGTGNTAMMKLYRFTIYESEVLVHDYVPAVKGGNVGMYDEVTGEFIYDIRNTTTTFDCGGDILQLEDDAYIESLGGGMMNSRFYMAPDAKVDIDYALTDASDPNPTGSPHYQQRVFGADASSFTASYYINGSGKMSFGGGDAFIPSATTCAADLYRHRAVMDVPSGKAYYITRSVTNWNGAAFGSGATVTKTAVHGLALFGNMSSTNGTTFAGGQYRSKAKIYRFKCWKAGELVHDYVPCVKGGTPGFKDLVDGAFITAENTAQLRAGGKGLIVEDDDGYISSAGNDSTTGYRYIDTGYTVTPHTRVELDYALADNYPDGTFSDNHTWYLFTSYGGSDSTRFNVYYNKNKAGWCGAGLQWRDWYGGALSKPSTGKDVRRTAIVDNHTGFSGIITSGFTNLYANVEAADESLVYTYTLKLATSHTALDCYAPLKIYGLKIYEGGTLVRNYEPCVKNGAAALHDTLTDTFLFSAPKGAAFVAGGNIANFDGKCDAYLESDGTQAINTEYLIKGSESRIEADFAFLDMHKVGSDYQQRAFGKLWQKDNTSEIDAVFYINGSGNFMFAFGNAAVNTRGPSVPADSLRHTAVIDGYHSRLHFITGGVTNKTYDVSDDAHNANSTLPMGIFAVPENAAGTGWRQSSKLRLYALRVYERDELLHEYIPYKKGEVLGLYDTLTGEVKTDARNSATPFKVSGMGVDGAERWIVQPKNRMITKSATLSANAAGAVGYRWTKNGEAVDGGEDGDLTVEWVKGGGTDTYTVTPVYDVYGREVEGAPVSFTVENASRGTLIVIG